MLGTYKTGDPLANNLNAMQDCPQDLLQNRVKTALEMHPMWLVAVAFTAMALVKRLSRFMYHGIVG